MDFKRLWPGGPLFAQPEGGFGFMTDSVLLADFSRPSGVSSCCDLGCGIGALTLLLAEKAPGAAIDALEIQPEWAEIARENAAANGMDGRVRVRCGDLREHRKLYTAGSCDLVVSNPPYFPLGGGKSPADEKMASAREELRCTLTDVAMAAAYLLKNGGRFCLVHRPERLSEIFCVLTAARLEPKRLRLVQHAPGAKPALALIEGRKNAARGLDVLPPLVLREADGRDSPEAKRIYHAEEGTP